jgi:3-hydroxyisobutyrate dehydrogenase-like beta-hydroxyacid dehydrogenase
MRIAVLGMGKMGHAVAGRLVGHDHEVVVWNRSPGKADDLVHQGAEAADTIAAALAGVDLVVTSMANDDAVRAVVDGDGGIRASLPDGATYVDTSTVSPSLSAELERSLPRFAAMPILGSPSAVDAGTAGYLLGGAPGVTAVVDPILALLTEKVERYETAALATGAKLTVNLILLNGVVALAEAFATGRAGGLSDDQLRSLLADSPMVAPGLANRFEGVLTGDLVAWWGPDLGAKDAGLAVDLAGSGGQQLPVTATVRDRYRQAAADTDADDIAGVSRLYRS